MKKLNVVLFSTFSISLTLYALLWPAYYLQLFISSGGAYLALRLLECAFMLAYVFMPRTRTYFAKTVMRATGLTSLLFGAATFISPTLFGYFDTYLPIGDTLIFLEGGILALLLSIELPAHQGTVLSTLVGNNLRYISTLLAAQPRKLTRVTRSSRTISYAPASQD